jgi:hypothetical protein
MIAVAKELNKFEGLLLSISRIRRGAIQTRGKSQPHHDINSLRQVGKVCYWMEAAVVDWREGM